jgi:hypothetical protein
MAIHKILGATAICAIVLGVVPTQAQEQGVNETGAYFGVNWARSSADSFRETYSDGSSISIPATKGDGFGFTGGYRVNRDFRAEIEFQQIDYDSAAVNVNNFTVAELGSVKADWLAFSIVWQGNMGLRNQFQPYFKFSYVDGDSSGTLRRQGYQQVTVNVEDSGNAYGVGFDYMMTDEMFLRCQMTIFDGEDTIAIGPIWHF